MIRSAPRPVTSPEALWKALGIETASSTGGAIGEALFPLAVGMAVGAGIALLLAPKTGAQMRKDLARRLRFDRNDEFAEKVQEEGGLPGPVKHIAP
jgi:hypothetical protein